MKHKSRFLLPILTFLTFGLVTGTVVVTNYENNSEDYVRSDAVHYGNSTFYFLNRTGWGNDIYIYYWDSDDASKHATSAFVDTGMVDTVGDVQYSILKVTLDTASCPYPKKFQIRKDYSGSGYKWNDEWFYTDGRNYWKDTGDWYRVADDFKSYNRTIYFYKNGSSNVNCYAWDNFSHELSGYPGSAMTSMGNGYWKIDIPYYHCNFIFNHGDGDGNKYTGNLSLSADSNNNFYRYNSDVDQQWVDPWSVRTMYYKFDNGSWIAMTGEDKSGCLHNYYTSSLSQVAGNKLYLEYTDINNSTVTIDPSIMDRVGGEGANNFAMDDNNRPTIRYTNVTGNIDARIVHQPDNTYKVYAWAKGLNDSNAKSFSLIINNTNYISCSDKGSGDSQEWYKTDLVLEQNDKITILDKQCHNSSDYGVEYNAYLDAEATDVTKGDDEICRADHKGKYDLYIKKGTNGWDVIYSSRSTRIITYDLNNTYATSATPATNYYATYNQVIAAGSRPTNPTANYYTFTGWYNGESAWNMASSKVLSDMELTAHWSAIDYTISYELNGGSASNVTSYNIETETFSLNNPTKANSYFLGWTGDGYATPSKSVTISQGSHGDKTFTANWVSVDREVVLGEGCFTIVYKILASDINTEDPSEGNIDLITFDRPDPNTMDGTRMPKNEYAPSEISDYLDGDYYVFGANVNAGQLTDPITFTIEKNSETLVSFEDKAAELIIAQSESEAGTLDTYKAILNYGTATQLLYNYREGDLASAYLSEDAEDRVADVNKLCEEMGKLTINPISGCGYALYPGKTVLPVSNLKSTIGIENKITARVSFEYDGDISDITVALTNTSIGYGYSLGANPIKHLEGNKYYVEVKGIGPDNYNNAFRLNFSVDGCLTFYVKNAVGQTLYQLDNDANPVKNTFARAMYLYSTF